MINNIESLELKEFLNVYPKIIPKIENEKINIFKKCFKKQNIPLEKLNEEQFTKNRYSFNKTKSLINIIKNNNRKSFNIKLKGNKLLKGQIFSSLNNNISNLNDNNNEINEDEEYKELENEENEDLDVNFNQKGGDYFLINKGIFLQENKRKRTEDVKYGLELFLFGSNFFDKLSKNLNSMNLKIKKSKKFLENENDQEIQSKIKNKLNNIISKLSERVIIKKYEKDNFVVKMNEIGRDCYFLISGKISILKPVEYNVTIYIREYFIYLKCLFNYDEIDLILKVLSINRKILDISNLDEISKLIRAYFIILLRRELNKNYGGITMELLENFFKYYHFTFEDFQLSKDIILNDIEDKKGANNKNNFEILLLKYISEKIPLLNEDIYLLELYRILSNEKEKYSITLYKYEIFLYLYPGNFFGDMALDNKIKKRNATIRTETDCIICSLSNDYYVSLLSEENKKIKTLDLIFLCHNFFFNLISPVIFNTKYYPMFKSVEKLKNAVLYKQNDNISSLYLVREGTLKIGIYANVFDLFNIIKNIINEICYRNNYFKISPEDILVIKKHYLKDKNLSKIFSDENISFEANKKINFELFTSSGYEFLGIQDFCLKTKYLCSCTVISNRAILMEIKRNDLSYMIKNEKIILQDYYNYVYKKLILLIKRLHYLKDNLINQLTYKLDMKSYIPNSSYISNDKNQLININIQGNNNHKQKIQILNSDKAKNIYNEKYNSFETNLTKNISNSFSLTDRKYLSLKNKNISKGLVSFGESNLNNNSSSPHRLLKLNKYNLKNKRRILSPSNLITIENENDSLQINKNEINKIFFCPKTKNKKNSQNNNEENINKINNDIVNTKHGYISLKKIKKSILKNNEDNMNITKLSIVRKLILSNYEEKSIECNNSYLNIKPKRDYRYKYKSNYNMPKSISIKKKKYDDIKNNLLTKDEAENNNKKNESDVENPLIRGNKSSINIKIKGSISNILYSSNNKEKNISERKKERNNSMTSLQGFNKKYKNINNLLGNMKRNYAISIGQKKFIFERKPQKNKVLDLIEDRDKNNHNSFRQKSIGQSIKNYYFKKKIEGYSALINPMHNTYINRQKTVKIKK